jgi:hypothetical protein
MRVVPLTAALALALPAGALGWGGTYTVADGTPVHVELSDAYPVDPAVAQGWADYAGSLVHGPELARVTPRLAPFPPADGTIVAAADRLYPGDERLKYRVNPGEGFAEAFRFLNELRAGVLSPAWTAVDPLLYPDTTALRLLEADVVSPWTGNTALTLGAARPRTFALSTPLDGTLVLRLHAPAGTYRLSLWRGATRLAGGSAFRYAICGDRMLTLRVARTGAAGGAYTIAVSRP